MKPRTRILTDLQMIQSPVWVQRTDFVDDIHFISNRLLDMLPAGLRARVKPFICLMTIILKMRRYDVVVTGNVTTGQMFAFFRRLFHLGRTKHVILELMLDEKHPSPLWELKRRLQQFLFSAVDAIVVSSSKEVAAYSKRYGLPGDRFRFVRFHTNIREPRIIRRPDSYIFSAGRTGRDYQTLAEAVEGLHVEVVLVSDPESIKGINIPENARILINIPREEYLKLLEDCRLVVVPLQKRVKSTGQVAILEAMALGKPVIATNTIGTVDYITHKETGILVPPQDPGSLRHAILNLMDDQPFQDAIAEKALTFVKNHCTFEKYTQKILSIAEEIAGS